MQLRPYQTKAVDLLWRYFATNSGNPVLEAPTGAGKSVIQAAFMGRALEQFPGQRFLALTHVRELVSQNYNAMCRDYDGSIGIYSASLKRRDTDADVIFAGIQSVYRKSNELGRFDLVFIDEAHLCPAKTQTGMYRRFLDDCRRFNPRLKVIGFTATPYRLDGGYLTEGEHRLFTDLIPAHLAGMTIGDLVDQGHLSPLTTAPVQTHIAADGVAVRGGDYVQSDLQKAVAASDATERACHEIVRFGADRNAWLVFAVSVDHAHRICECLTGLGVSAAVVTGDTDSDERDRLIADYRRGVIRCLVNVNVLSTGFDAPHTDLLAFLRPTKSPGLYVQACGRGMRIHPGKSDCLVLDFARLIAEHGPVDAVKPPRRRGKKADSVPPLKECPECVALLHASARECPECGHVFEGGGPQIDAAPSPLEIMASGKPATVPVTRWAARAHHKEGKPPSVRVSYFSGLRLVADEWICIYHDGYAGDRALKWWRQHIGQPVPDEVDEAARIVGECVPPAEIVVKQEGKFARVLCHVQRDAA